MSSTSTHKESLTEKSVLEDDNKHGSVTVNEIFGDNDNAFETTWSVLDEVARFQQEINKVAVDNVKYPSWKQQRAGSRHISPEVEILPKTDIKKNQDSSSKPEKKSGTKRVTYAPHGVTVYNYEEEEPSHNHRHRQIQPSYHISHADDHEEGIKSDEVAEEDVPTLPSVKELASRFTVLRTAGSHSVMTVNKVVK